MNKPRILIFDIETAPNVAHVWNFWNNNVGINQVLEDGYIISFAAKWLGEDDVYYMENRDPDNPELTQELHALIDEADIVVAHNGKKFDMGWFRAECVKHKLSPPSPVKIVDTLRAAKAYFYFPSYRLEYLTKAFGCEEKSAHKQFPGHELWMECVVKNNDAAWAEMEQYNIQDVISLEELYLTMLPWIANHPNVGVLMEMDHPVCKGCGSEHLQKRGFQTTNLSKFQRYRCNDCGSWSRGRVNLLDKEVRKDLLTNAL